MVLYLIAVGRMRDASLRDACEEYTTRLLRYTRFEVREVRDAGRRGRDPDTVRRLEGEALLDALPRGARGFAMTRGGQAVSSEDLARLVASWQTDAQDVALIVGGAHGLHPQVLERAAGTISLSPLTLPHELARVVLTEQLYRAFTILRGEPYHKGTGA
jgi:23S rRNA (pseudouridine1915-N3)-methyltransferase